MIICRGLWDDFSVIMRVVIKLPNIVLSLRYYIAKKIFQTFCHFRKLSYLCSQIYNLVIIVQEMEKVGLERSETVSTVDALWTLIVRQNKSVQRDLARRLAYLVQPNKKAAQESYVQESLGRAIAEVQQANADGASLPDARLLFDEIDK